MEARSLRRTATIAAACASLLAALAVAEPAGAPVAAADGTFRLLSSPDDFDYVDPALAYRTTSWALLDATCALLLNYPDRRGAFKPVPEVAVALPRSSNDAKTFTFRVRSGFRFSDGTPVQASAYARAINRVLAAGPRFDGYQFVSDIVGAEAVRDGKRSSAAGLTASGNRLVVRLRASAPDFPVRTAMPFFCAVPPNLPPDPEGVGPFPGSGPYYFSEYVRGKRVVVSRNPFYRGARPHNVDRIVADLRAGTPQELLRQVERGEADWAPVGPPFYYDPVLRLVEKYGINKSRLFVEPGLTMRGFAFNTARPLFRDNVLLRRAVNFAVDRRALINVPFTPRGIATDQYLPLHMPGYRNARIYPLNAPDLKRARALARGHTRSGKAVLWTFDVPPALASAQILKGNLRSIGLDVTIRGIPPGAYGGRISAPGAPFDIVFSPWVADFADPQQYLNVLLDSRFAGATNLGRFASPVWDARMRRTAKLEGAARYRAYGDLDARLSRDAAPRLAIANDHETTFVSSRVGCIVLRPYFDLTAACLK
jgi:ABC-type oligopeptide transport system substrate-binding subunit